jgi:mannose-6-phosphate isomerase-like protein (cupin superfamily)
MDSKTNSLVEAATRGAATPFDITSVKERLERAGGGYEVVHASPALEVGVYVLVAPEPDRQQPHEDDELYIVLDGHGVLEVEGVAVPFEVGQAMFVPAGANHGFTAYEHMSVLVIFARAHAPETVGLGLGPARVPV